MAVNVVTVNRDTKPGVGPILWGMWLTLENMLRVLFRRGASTIQWIIPS